MSDERRIGDLTTATELSDNALFYAQEPMEADPELADKKITKPNIKITLGIDALTAALADLAGTDRTTENVKDNADAIAVLAAAVASVITPTGKIEEFTGDVLPTGYIWARGETIGNAASGATYAGDEYHDLFDMYNVADRWGNDGTAVWASGNTVKAPDKRNRVGYGANDDTIVIDGVTHPATPLGATHNDRGQGWQLGMAQIATGGPVYYGSTRLDNYIINGTVSAEQGLLQMKNDQQGAATMAKAYSDGTNGTPRTGATTMAVGIGVNFIIKM